MFGYRGRRPGAARLAPGHCIPARQAEEGRRLDNLGESPGRQGRASLPRRCRSGSDRRRPCEKGFSHERFSRERLSHERFSAPYQTPVSDAGLIDPLGL